MAHPTETPDTPAPDALAVWDRIAPWWAEQVGEGNDFQRRLIIPTTDKLLAPRAGQTILDVACGNGNYARHLARLGANVVAFDGSANFVAAARRRTSPQDGRIEYHVIDATDEGAMRALGAGRFDAAVCSMAVMDLPTIDPLLRAVHALLKPGGAFVFSLSHPCFNSNASRMTAELINEAGRFEQVHGVHVTRYLSPTNDRSAGIVNQPEPIYTFHRPLSAIMGACFAAGFVVDGFEEPAYPVGAGAKSAFSWAKRPDLPPAVVLRVRRG